MAIPDNYRLNPIGIVNTFSNTITNGNNFICTNSSASVHPSQKRKKEPLPKSTEGIETPDSRIKVMRIIYDL
jgi:hypothetical protein